MIYRIAAKGILEQDNKILFIQYSDTKGIYYSLPGGKHETGESLADTVVREFKEETSLDVRTEKIVMVREFISSEPDVEIWAGGIHQVETIFTCTLLDSSQKIGVPLVPDTGMLYTRWIHKSELKNYRIYPTNELAEILERNTITYLFTNS